MNISNQKHDPKQTELFTDFDVLVSPSWRTNLADPTKLGKRVASKNPIPPSTNRLLIHAKNRVCLVKPSSLVKIQPI